MATLAPTQIQNNPEHEPQPFSLPRDVRYLDTFRSNGEDYLVDSRFQIGRRLTPSTTSSKAYSVVYEAHDLQGDGELDTEADSVVKILLDNTMDKALAGTIESEVAKSLPAHENIVTSIGQGEIPTRNGRDYRYLAFERANYGTWVHPKFPLSALEMVDVIGGVARGMQHIQSHGIVHKDIKPHNIGLHRTETGELVAKILDFGAARPIKDDPDELKINRSPRLEEAIRRLGDRSMAQFTEGFISPEARRKGEATGASDVYSLGRSILDAYDFLGTVGDYRIDDDTGQIEPEIDPNPLLLPERIPRNIGIVACECLNLDPNNRLKPTEIQELLHLAAA